MSGFSRGVRGMQRLGLLFVSRLSLPAVVATTVLLAVIVAVTGCGSTPGATSQTTPPQALAISTASLPGGETGTAYSATLTATGGTTPYTWSVASGALPAGLTLNPSTGTIGGTPTTSANALPLTFQVTDSSNPQQSKAVSLTLTIAAAPPPVLTITTTLLPNGQAGSAYSATLTATGGMTPYTWAVASGALPAGLTLNPATGVISGTPATSANEIPLTFQVTDSSTPQQSKLASLTLKIAAAPLTITTTSLPSGQVGTAYTATLSATGGTTPYLWTLTNGTLPAGLVLNSSTGVISGTPTASAGAALLTFTITDSGNPQQGKSVGLMLTIAAAPLMIATTSLPSGQAGAAYSATLMATGGTMPYTWTLTSGTLPAGLSLSPMTGMISGTPTVTANATPLTFTVIDSGNPQQAKSVSLTLTIAVAPLAITTPSLPSGQVGTAYSATLTATGGTIPYTWSLAGGTLPAGLLLNTSTGVISGTPTATVTSTPLTLTVADAGNPQQNKLLGLTLTIVAASAPALSITTTSLPSGQVGTAYTATLTATGGTTPYTWSLSSGTLPGGLLFNAATGAISGTPTAAVNAAPLTFQVIDSGNPAQNKLVSLTLTIAPAPLVITTTSLPSGEVGTAYTATLTATGGTTPYTWTLTGGTLPSGLVLNASTGTISGTPTAVANAAPLTFTVTDSGNPAQQQLANLTLTIASAPLTITTTSLPSGQVGTAYNATLTATGGTTPYTWSLTSGTLPGGLLLNASTGAISGTPTAAVSATPLTFQVADSGTPEQQQLANLTLTITPVSTIQYVSPSHTVCTQTSSNTASQTCTLNAPTTAGDEVVVGLAWKNTSSSIGNVAGSAPSSYFFLYSQKCNGTSGCVATLVCHRCASQTAVTTTMTAGTAFVTTAEEYSGVQALGITGTATATSTTPGLTLATGDVNDWLVCSTVSPGSAGIPTAGIGNLRDASGTGATSSDIAAGTVDNTAPSAGGLGCMDTTGSSAWAATGVELRSVAPRTYIWPDCDTTHPCVVHHIDTVSDGTVYGETLQGFKFPMVPSSPGNLLIFTVTHVSDKSITVTDNNNGNWQTAVTTTNTTDGEETEVRYICGATPGTNLITIQLSQPAEHDEILQFSYSEVSGIAPAACLDGAGTGANGLSGVVQPGALATSTDGDLIYNFGEETYQYPEYDNPIGWVMPDDNSALLLENTYDKFASQISIQAAHGTYNPTLYVNADPNARLWNAVAAAFLASPGAGTQPTGIHITRIMHFLNPLVNPVWTPFPSTGNAIVITTSNPSAGNGMDMANLADNLGAPLARTPFVNADTDPQIYSTCFGSGTGGRDFAIDWTPDTDNTHLLIYDIAGAATTGGSAGCVGATVNNVQGDQGQGTNANMSGDPVITPEAVNSVIITTSYVGTGPPSGITTPNAVFNSIWATGMTDPSHWDTGDPYAYIYTTSTSPISFGYTMANAPAVPDGGTYFDGAAIEILPQP